MTIKIIEDEYHIVKHLIKSLEEYTTKIVWNVTENNRNYIILLYLNNINVGKIEPTDFGCSLEIQGITRYFLLNKKRRQINFIKYIVNNAK